MSFYSNSGNTFDARAIGFDMSAIMRAVYMWLAVGLLIAFGVSYAVGMPVANAINNGVTSYRQLNSPLFNPAIVIGALIVYMIMAFTIQPVIMRSSPAIGIAMYLAFSALFGFMMATIFITYTVSQIFSAFMVTAAMFGAMSIIGYTTKIDLSKLGSILFMALIGLIIASVVNIFLNSGPIMWLINYAGVLIFTGFVAYDTQWIKNYAAQIANTGDGSMVQRIALIGAFHLFLDFVNLFMFILRIMGGGRRR